MKFPFPEKIPMTLCILAAAAVALLLLLPGTAGDSGIQTAVTRLESEDTQEYVENHGKQAERTALQHRRRQRAFRSW